MPLKQISRRTMIKISLGLPALMGLSALLKYLGYQPSPSLPTRFTLKPPIDYPPNSVTSIPEARTWLVHDAAGLYALSAVCTHLGCIVNFAEPEFKCPCHGSRYDRSGQVTNGPAIKPLRRVELTLSADGLVVLDTSKMVPIDQRLTF
jgi:cytochrome b6-f complex iron-sulfur subunit